MRPLFLPLFLIALAVPSSAEQVTYRFTGAVTRLSDASLAPWFSLGDPFMLDVTVDRSTLPLGGDPSTGYHYQYYFPFSGAVGNDPIGPGSGIVVQVGNDVQNTDYLKAPHSHCDYFRIFDIPSGQTVGPGIPIHVCWLELYDDDATALDQAQPPRVMPDPDQFEVRRFFIPYDVYSPPHVFVEVTLDSWTTPARPTSWGRIKATYLL